MTRLCFRLSLAAALVALAACQPAAPPAQPPQPDPEGRFASLEHDYAVYIMSRFPVVATYLGGSAFDPALAHIDGKLRDYSPQALQAEDARLAEFRDRFKLAEKWGAPYYSFHRADLLDALASTLDGSQIHLGHRLVGATARSDGVELVFGNGQRVQAEYVIGADGERFPTLQQWIDSRSSSIH